MEFLTQFLETSGGIVYIIFFFIVALSIIVAVHEYGHYIVGRWCGIKADVFSIGFGPVLLSRTDRHGTVWQFAAFPLGGYVKFKGDANAASVGSDGTVAEAAVAPRDTMLGAPLWARAATIFAGPAFNFVMSFFIFAGIGLSVGQVATPLAVGETKPLPFVMELEPGDVLLEIEGEPFPEEDVGDFYDRLPAQASLDYKVLRDGEEIVLQAPHPQPPSVSSVVPRSPAFQVEIRPGDVVTAVEGEPIYTIHQLIDAVQAAQGRAVLLDVWRDGQMLEFVLAPERRAARADDGSIEERYLIGIRGGSLFEPATERRGLLQAAEAGFAQVWFIITASLEGMWKMITGVISTCNISGPVGIAVSSGAAASEGPSSFIWFVAVLSTAVGLLNLLPVPILDGGHLVFHAYEAVRGRPPSEKALRVLMSVGLAMVGSLMFLALFSDLFC